MGAQLEFTLKGRPDDEGLVRAGAFVKFLQDALEALRRIEHSAIGSKRPVLDYRVVELEIGSAVVGFEPIVDEEDPEPANKVRQTFVAAMEAAQRGRLQDVKLDAEARAAIERLIAPPTISGITAIGIRVDGKQFSFTPTDTKELQLHPPAEVSAVGSFSGFIDAVNVHTEPVFYLYPVVGPSRITCAFERTMLDEVRRALRRYVTVYGLTEYIKGMPYPYRIVVERLELHPDVRPPSVRELIGIAPELTGGLPAETYIRSLRDANS